MTLVAEEEESGIAIQQSRPALVDQPRGRIRVLLIGNFLSGQGMYGVCEGLADRLTEAGHVVLRSSTKPNRAGRIVDMLSTAWRRR